MMASIGTSWNPKSEPQISEDLAASVDIMWSSSQTGCGPLKRLLMNVEPVYQSTQVSVSDPAQSGLNRAKANSAPSPLFSSHSSTSTANSSHSRPMKRTRSGSHVFASNRTPQQPSQSLELLGNGRLATEMLARVSHSLNEKAISEYTTSQQRSRSHQGRRINRHTQPLQSRSNIVLERNHNSPSRHSMAKRTFAHNLNEDFSENTHNAVDAKPSTTLKDSPKKGRLKALLQAIDDDKMSIATDLVRCGKDPPTRYVASAEKHSEGSSKSESTGIGRLSRCTPTAQRTLPPSDFIKVAEQKPNCIVRPTKLDPILRHNATSAQLPSKRTYRVERQCNRVDPILLRLLDDDHSPSESITSTVGTAVNSLDSFGDDSLYNDANSSSSYGDIDIDASLLEDVCKGYDT